MTDDWLNANVGGISNNCEWVDVINDDELLVSVSRESDDEVTVRVFEPGQPEDALEEFEFEMDE